MIENIYSVSETVPSGKVNLDYLFLECEGAGLPIEGSCLNGDELKLHFTTMADQAIVLAILQGHQGMAVPEFKFHATSKLIEKEASVSSSGTWEILGGVITSISFFISDMSKVVAKVTGEYRSEGSGAKLKMMEDQGGSKVMLTPTPLITEDTEGEWVIFTLYNSIIPRTGESTMTLEGDLGTASTCTFRFAGVTLLEEL